MRTRMKRGMAMAMCFAMVWSMGFSQKVSAKSAAPEIATIKANYKVTLEESASVARIQAEINHASNVGGGVITLSEGIYELSQPLELKSNVTLQGQGRETTYLKRSASCIIPDGKGVVCSKGGLQNVVVRDLCIDGNADTTPGDQAPKNSVYGLLITDINGKANEILYFDRMAVKHAHMGFHVKGTTSLYVKDSDFFENGSHYLYYHNLYLRRVYKAKLWKCKFHHSPSGNGVNISYSEDIAIDQCKSYSNYFRGIRAANSERIDVLRCKVFKNKTGDGIIINSETEGVKDFRVKRCKVYKNGQYGIHVNQYCSDGQLWYNVDGGGNKAGYIFEEAENVSYR